MDILKASSAEEFVRLSVEQILKVIKSSKKPVIGLSGGSTPKPVYEALSREKDIDWKTVTFFVLDERYVPADYNDSNQKMILETLAPALAAGAAIIAPDTSLPLEQCIKDYDQKVSGLKPDLLLLGMGEDGHIASLFPPVGPEAYGPQKVIHTTTDRFAVRDRISVAFPVLKDAAKRIFLITGEKKSALLQKMQQTNEDASLYPAQYLFDERTTWIVG
jgi:6-phosphogluconolactonase